MYKDHLYTKDTKLVLLVNADWPGELKNIKSLNNIFCKEPGLSLPSMPIPNLICKRKNFLRYLLSKEHVSTCTYSENYGLRTVRRNCDLQLSRHI